jgi:hypothetical protein
MGMDVFGNNKEAYFRNNVWWWHPLADYCMKQAPAVTSACKDWHTNSGCGLNEERCKKLAEILDEELSSGRTAAYARIREETLNALPLVKCKVCDGTGKRLPPPATGAGDVECNGCGGQGQNKAWETNYPFSEDNVREWIGFLETCGGFKIC